MHGPELVHALRYKPELKHISTSLKTIDKNSNYAQKTDLQAPKMLTPTARPDHPPPIFLFETSLINQAFQLYESCIRLKLRGSAATEPENRKFQGGNRAKTLNF